MRVQQTNNQQSFGMALRVKTGGMKAEEIRAVINNKALLDEAFKDIDAVLSIQYKDKIERSSLPVGWFTKWCENDYHLTREYSFESSPTNKSFWEKLKHFFGRGIILKTGSKDTKELTKQDEFDVVLKDATTFAKKNYAENTRVLARAERVQLKAERTVAKTKAAVQRKAALEEFQQTIHKVEK